MSKESDIYLAVSKYMRHAYPNAIFRFDGAGVRLTMGQAVFNKKINPHSGYPDFFLAEKRGEFYGLYIEIKRIEDSPFLKSGLLRSSEHVKDQQQMIDVLNKRGYYALFGIGTDHCIRIIENYMNLN